MAEHGNAPVIRITDLPDYPQAIALHGARLGSASVTSVNDDLWIVAVIVVYESAA